MKRTFCTKKSLINGGYTFASERALTDQLVDAYCEYVEMNPEDTFHLYLQFHFLDTQSQLKVYRFCRLVLDLSEKESRANVKITFLYDWKDSSMEEFGIFLEEVGCSKVKLYQVDHTEQNCISAVA